LIRGGDALETLSENLDKIMESAGRFSQAFINATEVAVPHNLGRNPTVTILDDSRAEVDARVVHTDVNNLTVFMNQPLSGTVFCS
jgi:hypothetical protein